MVSQSNLSTLEDENQRDVQCFNASVHLPALSVPRMTIKLLKLSVSYESDMNEMTFIILALRFYTLTFENIMLKQ